MSISSHTSRLKNTRPIQAPQRANGKMRVAAILEAAAAVIDEKGYEGATMAEIAARSGTKIGSLYRFFPNKESLAETILVSSRQNLDAVFDSFDAEVNALSILAMADGLMTLIFELFTTPAFMKLLDVGHDWSVKREEFRTALMQRIAKTLTLHTPSLSKKSAADMALVILLNTKALVAHRAFFDAAPGAPDELRDMTRLYLQSRLSAKQIRIT